MFSKTSEALDDYVLCNFMIFEQRFQQLVVGLVVQSHYFHDPDLNVSTTCTKDGPECLVQFVSLVISIR